MYRSSMNFVRLPVAVTALQHTRPHHNCPRPYGLLHLFSPSVGIQLVRPASCNSVAQCGVFHRSKHTGKYSLFTVPLALCLNKLTNTFCWTLTTGGRIDLPSILNTDIYVFSDMLILFHPDLQQNVCRKFECRTRILLQFALPFAGYFVWNRCIWEPFAQLLLWQLAYSAPFRFIFCPFALGRVPVAVRKRPIQILYRIVWIVTDANERCLSTSSMSDCAMKNSHDNHKHRHPTKSSHFDRIYR